MHKILLFNTCAAFIFLTIYLIYDPHLIPYSVKAPRCSCPGSFCVILSDRQTQSNKENNVLGEDNQLRAGVLVRASSVLIKNYTKFNSNNKSPSVSSCDLI